jgi:hypothetical protein
VHWAWVNLEATGTHPWCGRALRAVVWAAAAALVVLPPAASGAVPTQRLPFGQWVAFDIGGVGSFDSEGVFTFTSDVPVILRVTDGYCRGDRYRVLDHGHRLMLTSDSPLDPTCDDLPFVTDPAQAWQDTTYSKGHRRLAPGYHRIHIRSVRSPFGGSTAWLEALRVP